MTYRPPFDGVREVGRGFGAGAVILAIIAAVAKAELVALLAIVWALLYVGAAIDSGSRLRDESARTRTGSNDEGTTP